MAVVGLLVGVGGTTARFLLHDRFDVPEYTFNVAVFLKADVTTAQRDEVRAALQGIDTLDGVRYETREEAYENFKQLYKDSPDLVASVRPDTLPESFRFRTKGTDFDCGILDPVQDLPGLDEVVVSAFPKDRGTLPKFVSCS